MIGLAIAVGGLILSIGFILGVIFGINVNMRLVIKRGEDLLDNSTKYTNPWCAAFFADLIRPWTTQR